MAMGIVSDSEFELELNRLNKSRAEGPSNDVNVELIKHGRGHVPEVPESVREFIGGEAINGAPHKLLSSTFGISESSISAYKHGATSTATYHNPDQKLLNHARSIRERIVSKSNKKLIRALDFITDDKLAEARVRDLATIAQAMSSVSKNMEPSEVVNQTNNMQVVVYKPRMKDEDDFEAIEVHE